MYTLHVHCIQHNSTWDMGIGYIFFSKVRIPCIPTELYIMSNCGVITDNDDNSQHEDYEVIKIKNTYY